MIIYCDGVFDMFHYGHLEHFKKIKELFPKCYLIVAIMDDISTKEYKRTPIFNFDVRYKFCNSCKYIDKAIQYEEVDEEFINKNNIDMVVHAFYDNKDFEKQKIYFEIPIKLNKMKVLEYSHGISTTQLIKKLDNCSSLISIKSKDISKILNTIKVNSKVLIISDYNFNMPNKNLELYFATFDENVYFYNIKFRDLKVYLLKMIDLPFKDKYFDYCIIDLDLKNVLKSELNRVSNHIFFN